MRFFAISAAFLSLSGIVASATIEKRNCPEAARFGTLSVFPLTASAGDDISVSLSLNCPTMQFGIVPQFLDYTLEVPEASNNGNEQPIVLTRRTYTFVPGTIQPMDDFTVQIPHGPFVAGAPYNIVLNMVYPIDGTDGSSVLVETKLSVPITINA
ncbi:hypothetical protein JR316_0004192 [Psilocybe cubensis]|uniref:Uncharacterized protein n=2 Tax=Psilocybe cubensis TaxID=181762 RepID=A0A8H8CKD6_PSICU|nr:hypothetical protein JR316_0004192 [Psilocybe cubensis]KAH9482097.1 hypothetical protein JR316_0004192 [Psilocybe cubensis]